MAVPLDKTQSGSNFGEDDGSLFTAPTPGIRAASQWVNNSSYAADHVAAGSFETAMQLLNRCVRCVCFMFFFFF